MTKDEIRDAALRALSRIAPEADLGSLKHALRLRDQFDFDSVDFLNYALALQAEVKIAIPETDYPKLATLQGCVEYLSSRLS